MNQAPDSRNDTPTGSAGAAGGSPDGGPVDPGPSDRKPAGGPASARPEHPQRPREKEGGFWHVVGKIFHVLLMPLIWVFRPLIFRIGGEKGNPKVYFTSFSTLMYLWPIMVVGILGVFLRDWNLVSSPTLGWIWITVTLIVILCVGSDTDRNKTIVLLLVVGLFWLGGLLLEAKQGIPILSHIYDYFAGLNVQFEPGTAKVFSLVTLIVLFCVVAIAWFDGRYEITTREITHKRVFRTSDSLPRAAKRVKRDWRDLTEVFLGLGAGDLIVLDSNRNIEMRIPNIPFLWFFRQDVDHILEVLATTEVEDIAAAIEEDEAG